MGANRGHGGEGGYTKRGLNIYKNTCPLF